MDDVYLEGATPDGPAVVGHLSVIVDTAGITFLGPEAGERRTVGWERTSPLEFGAPAALPDGEQATSLEFVVDGRPLRLLVPSQKGPHGLHGNPHDEVAPVEPAVTPTVIHMAEPLIPEVAPVDPPVTPTVIHMAEPLIPEVAPVDPPVTPTVIHMAEPLIPEVAPVEPAVAPTVIHMAEPPAAVSAVPPAPVYAVPPAPVPAEPPVPDAVEPPPSVGVIQDTFVGFETEHADWSTDDDPDQLRLPTWFKYVSHRPKQIRRSAPTRRQSLVRLVLFTVLAGLIPIAAGVRYFQMQSTTGHIVGVPISDSVIAGRVGIQAGDLPGWAASTPTAGNAFAAGATTQGTAAASTAAQASTDMARCLHVPVSAVAGAFGMGDAVSQITAQVPSLSYADPAGNGSVSSVADVVKSTQAQETDASVFQDPALFATCYQPFVQAMLPYSAVAGGSGFATATVQPIVVPVPAGPGAVTVAGFQIARIANDKGQTKTVISTATAIFDGRVQVTMGTDSNLVFPIDTQNQLVRAVEVRTIGVGQL
jgi:hypothetical protein